jgi:hypothetical protein
LQVLIVNKSFTRLDDCLWTAQEGFSLVRLAQEADLAHVLDNDLVFENQPSVAKEPCEGAPGLAHLSAADPAPKGQKAINQKVLRFPAKNSACGVATATHQRCRGAFFFACRACV